MQYFGIPVVGLSLEEMARGTWGGLGSSGCALEPGAAGGVPAGVTESSSVMGPVHSSHGRRRTKLDTRRARRWPRPGGPSTVVEVAVSSE